MDRGVPREEEGGERAGNLAFVAKMFPRLSETFVSNEVLALRRAGVPVRVYSILPPARDCLVHPEVVRLAEETDVLPQPSWRELSAFLIQWGRCIRAAPGRTLVETRRAFRSPTSLRQLFRGIMLAERLRSDRISHVHAAWAHTPAKVALVASRLTGIPWSMAAHAKDIHTTSEDSIARKMSSARFTLACTASHRDLLREIAGRRASVLSPGEVRLAYHGVDPEFFSPFSEEERLDPPSSPPTILFVGRLVPKKGIELLIDAAALLLRHAVPFRLEIVGEGPLRAPLSRRVDELGMAAVVTMRGSLVRHEVRDAMRRASCFALPCRVTPDGDRDGIPNSLAEAMAVGLPVVSTRLPSIEELVDHGSSGLLVPPNDPEALASALAEVLRDAKLRGRLGSQARRTILERFDARWCEAQRIQHLARSTGIARILYLSADRGVPVRGGKGASIHVRSLIQAWHAQDVETLLVTANGGPRDGAGIPAEIREARAGAWLTRTAKTLARCFGRGDASERAWLRLADQFPLLAVARQAAAVFRPDMIYERYALTSIAGSFLARWKGIPHVLEVNAPLADEEARYRGLGLARLTRSLERWTMRRADVVVVVSHELKHHACRLGVKPERIRVLPNGVDPARFHPGLDGGSVRRRLGIDGEFVAGFSGSLKPWHGVDHLVRAFASAADVHPGMKLVILGEGPERASLENLVQTAGVADRVLFPGAIPHEEVGMHLAACDVLCAPYGRLEKFYFSPIKIAEYLATGRPVIASEVAPLKRCLGPAAHDVIWTAPGDEGAITRALLDLARRGRKSERAVVRPTWTWSDVARNTLQEAEGARRRLWKWKPSEPSVGYVVKVFPRFSETFILDEILELERRGVPIAIFSMKTPPEEIQQPGVERMRAPVIVLSEEASTSRVVKSHLACFVRSPLRYARTAAFAAARGNSSARAKFLVAPLLAHEARRLGLKHLHAHFANAPARQAKFASMLSGIPFSFTAHAKDLYWSGNGHANCRKLNHKVRQAKFVVAISDRNRHFLQSVSGPVAGKRVTTIYNGLDLERWPFRRPDGRPVQRESCPIVLAVGRLVEKKGFHVLLESLATLRGRGLIFRCWIAGEGPDRERLQSRIVQHGLDDIAELLGPIPRDRIFDLYPKAHLLAIPSIVAADGDQDGIPTVLLEALGTGLPVVATPVSGIREAVFHEETGLLTPPGDSVALADAMARLIEDDELAARVARQGRRLVEARFDLRANVSQLASRFRSEEIR